MKIYVVYEQTCYDIWNNMYFIKEENTYAELYNREYECRQKDIDSYWKVKEVETED